MSFHPSSIFEVHLSVADRRRATEFYVRVLGCEVAAHIERRDITFLWLGGRGSVMIGLWGPSCPDPPITRGVSHFAMQLPISDILSAPERLLKLGVQPLGFSGEPISEPIVLAWMPAISVYFTDLDDNSLEFICMLPDSPLSDRGIVTWSEWSLQSSASPGNG